MKNFIDAMDNLPWIVKIILCLPVLDIIWAVYRIVKGVTTKNLLMLIFGILWIIPGSVFCWVIDILCTLFAKRPILFA